MAIVNRRCGHQERQLRDSAAARLLPCAACVEAGAAWIDARDLPALAGSEAQVAWADSIRREKVATFGPVTDRGQAATIAANLTEPERQLAAWWIERRNAAPAALLLR